MRPRSTVVAHRDPLIAEALMTALSSYPGLAPVRCASTLEALLSLGRDADCVGIDRDLPGCAEAIAILRRSNTRVVLIGDGEDDAAKVPTTASISALATALAPGILHASSIASRLTPREEEVLDLISAGVGAKGIARTLGISLKTVEQHKARIFAKLDVPNQTAAACWFVRTQALKAAAIAS